MTTKCANSGQWRSESGKEEVLPLRYRKRAEWAPYQYYQKLIMTKNNTQAQWGNGRSFLFTERAAATVITLSYLHIADLLCKDSVESSDRHIKWLHIRCYPHAEQGMSEFLHVHPLFSFSLSKSSHLIFFVFLLALKSGIQIKESNT